MEKTSSFKKAPLKTLRVLDPTKTSPFVVPTTIRKEAPTGNTPMGNSSQSSNQSFSSGRGKSNSRGFRGHFRPHSRGRGHENPSSQRLLSSLPQSTSRRLPLVFQKRLAHKQMFKQRVKHYHQWLRSSIHLKTKFSQSPTDSIRLQGPPKRTSSDLLYPVSSVKERNRKGGKCNICQILQSPVSCTQASPKVEASNRPKQAQHLPTCRKVQNGNTRVHQGLSDSRGMGVVDRPIVCLPSLPHPPKLKEVPKVLPQVASVSVHLPSLRTSHGPSGLYNDSKRGEADGPVKGNQTSPVPGRLADQGPVSGRSTSKHSDSGGPNSVLRVDNKSGEVRIKTCSSVFVRGLRFPPRFSPCKTHSREMAQTSGFDPATQVKTCFLTARCLMSLIGLLASTEKMVPEGRLHI